MFNWKNKDDKNRKYNALADYDGDPMVRQLFFFGFYFVFFLILIFLLRTGYKKNASNPVEKKTGYKEDYNFSELFDENYHFVYKEYINNEEYIYEGDCLDGELSFVKSGNPSTSYYKKNDTFYIKDNNLLTWNETNNPMVFYPFILPLNINKIVTNGNYISYVTYIESKEKEFNYEIKNNSIRKLLDLEEIPNDETKSTIVIRTKENKNLKTITLYLTEYYKIDNPILQKYIITINYSKIGKVEEIASPIN